MGPIPIMIQRSGIAIEINWSDGDHRSYQPRALREACPCAICREKKAAVQNANNCSLTLPVLSQAETGPLEILKMEPVGNYAYAIQFSDGHNSGIFSFDLLKTQGETCGLLQTE